MDTFTFLLALMLLMLAVQYGANWMVFGILAVMVLSMRSVSTTILLVVSVIVLYALRGANLYQYWPFVVFGLIILALVLGMGAQPAQPEYYSPDMAGYGGLMEGM